MEDTSASAPQILKKSNAIRKRALGANNCEAVIRKRTRKSKKSVSRGEHSERRDIPLHQALGLWKSKVFWRKVRRKQLIGVLKALPGDLLFILETSGILIGYDNGYAEELAHFENLCVRVSLKGAAEQEFVTLTGAKSEGFGIRIKALENLHRAGVNAQPCGDGEFFNPRNPLQSQQEAGADKPRL
jgi:hypothetical protein